MKVKKQQKHYLKKYLGLLSLNAIKCLQYLLESALDKVDWLYLRLSRSYLDSSKFYLRRINHLNEKYIYLNRNPYKGYEDGMTIDFNNIDIVQLYSFKEENKKLIKDYKEWLWSVIHERNKKLIEEHQK